jgi:hypothetical protein
VALRQKLAHDVRADKASTSGNERLHAVSVTGVSFVRWNRALPIAGRLLRPLGLNAAQRVLKDVTIISPVTPALAKLAHGDHGDS